MCQYFSFDYLHFIFRGKMKGEFYEHIPYWLIYWLFGAACAVPCATVPLPFCFIIDLVLALVNDKSFNIPPNASYNIKTVWIPRLQLFNVVLRNISHWHSKPSG